MLKQLMEAAAKAPSKGTSGREHLINAVGRITDQLKSEGNAAIDEFKAHIQNVRRALPPMAVRVLPEDHLPWTEEPAARSRMEALISAGFRRLGGFRLDRIPNYTFVGFIHSGQAAQAQVTRTGDTIVLELSSLYLDGTEFGSLDLAAKPGHPSAPWATSNRHPGMAPDALIREFLESRPKSGLVPPTPESFAPRIEDGFRRMQSWRSERGGFTEAELRQIHGLGDDAESAERAEMLRNDHAQRWLCNWLATRPDSGVSLPDALESLVIVYDEMSPDLVANAWWCGTGDIGLRSTEFDGGDPLEVFHEINQRRGEPLRLVCRKPAPFAADFYLPKPRPRPSRKSSALARAIKDGLARNDLRNALFDLREYRIKSDADAVAICEALRAMKPRETPDFTRQAQALMRLFQQVADLDSPAGVRLTREGLPLVANLCDELRKLRKEPTAGMAALTALQILARYGTAGGTDQVIAAARAGFERDGLGWSGVFGRFKPDHPQIQRLFATLSDSLPPGDIAGHLLTHANTLLLAGAALKHPFDSPAGRQRLLAWIRDTDPENSGPAHTATAAIPFLGRTGRKELLEAAARNPDLGVRMEAAWAEAKLGDNAGLEKLVTFCGHWSSTSAAQQYLKELGREELIPAGTQEPSFVALATMCDWLAHPNELGRVPDALEIVDHRELAWPPERVKKPFRVIRYRVRRSAKVEETGCGLVGSITFCLFSLNLESRPPEDVYAVHCCWELEQKELFSEESVEGEEAAKHASLLGEWRGALLQEAKLLRVAKLSRKLNYPRRTIGLARATLKRQKGYAILDGERSVWIRVPRLKREDVEACETLLLRTHVGRQLLGLAGSPPC